MRAWWRRLIVRGETEEEAKPEPLRVLEVRTEPSPALLQSDQADVSISVLNRRGRSLTGTLTLTGDEFRAEPAEFALDAVDRDRPFTAAVNVKAPNAPSAGLLQAVLNAVAYSNSNSTLAAGLRKAVFQFTDGNGSASLPVGKSIQVTP